MGKALLARQSDLSRMYFAEGSKLVTQKELDLFSPEALQLAWAPSLDGSYAGGTRARRTRYLNDRLPER